MSDKYSVSAFYKFTPCRDLVALKANLETLASAHSIEGLVVLAEEGVNGTVSSPPLNLSNFKLELEKHFGTLKFKDSFAEKAPFQRFKVRIDQEIVALGDPNVHPSQSHSTYLSPKEWEQRLKSGDPYFLVDVRNSYEIALGKFTGAVNPCTDKFNQFPDFVKKLEIPKETPVLMYCTGGIRCEKASVVMQQAGFKNIYQLDGGILRYIEELPKKSFEGECFVFDRRVSVDQDLAPSKQYSLCHYCGDPGAVPISCAECSQSAVICKDCEKQFIPATCSKNCHHHYWRKNGTASSIAPAGEMT